MAKITGVVVRETVPDSVLERADEIELVDLPPDELLQRLQEGKVYLPEQAQEAIRNFFRKGNLIALRELALRRTAERVDAQMQAYMRDHAIGNDVAGGRAHPRVHQPEPALGPARPRRPSAGRRGSAPSGSWPTWRRPARRDLPQVDRDRVIQTLRLAEQLGAETVTLSGTTMSEEILAYARDRNVSKIVIGKPGALALEAHRARARSWTPWSGEAGRSTSTS